MSLAWALVWNVGTCRPVLAGGEGLSTDAGHRGGPTRSSDEGSVMGLERRGRVILAWSMVNRGDAGGTG